MKKFSSLLLIVFLVFIFSIQSSIAQNEIISEGDSWLYFDDHGVPNEAWTTNSSSSKNWKTGTSPLGYGSTNLNTKIGFGDNPNDKHITKYFKKSFRLDNPHEFLMYELNIQRDDGVVIYLNGYEIWRNNMPHGKITDTTVAANLVFNNKQKLTFINRILSPEDFVYGVNTISASVHQARGASSDCLFNLTLVGNNNPEMLPLLLKERSLKNIELISKVKELNYNLEIEKKDLQLNFSEKAKKDFKITTYILSIALLILIATLIRGWYRYKNREFGLSEKNRALKETLKQRDQEMMSNSLNSLNNQQYLKDLKIEMERSAETSPTIKKVLSKIISKLDYQLDQDDDWGNLKKHFNAVHSGFFDKILSKHPALTEIELRHCAFIKLHMQTKEIAMILHINPRSVQASRYRIKKKMNLDENVDLREFLLNF